MNIAEALREAEQRLTAAAVIDSRRESASLLAFATGRDRTFLIAHPEYDLTKDEESAFGSVVKRRETREPFQYITGRQEFFGLEFAVTPDVLIPRPETELVVEAAIRILEPQQPARICEVGVGSGCIVVSILHSLKDVTGVGLDISPAAIEVARKNAETHGVAARIELRESDVFAALGDERFAMIVSNPPYVPSGDMLTLQSEVGLFEPHVALTDGADGLSIVRRIVAEAPRYLIAGGWLLLEIGFGQHEKVRALFSDAIWADVAFLPDLQGIPRTAVARLYAT
ncbi:MAG: peptide chain release factor N(5)-glutamine methyltransferase [Pyrinomonadaceae bacterium]|nr:peptide chain release factor N(5)-glutamine methyltransferase [Pyrinomonadaceae bacterium]